jgi:nucleoside 2-deoxyribosyltransferase
MNNIKTYLAGPIEYGSAPAWERTNLWRNRAAYILGEQNVLNPALREYPEGTVDKLVEDDHEEIQSCDVLLANIWKYSPGTAMEVCLAHQWGKYVVVVCDQGRFEPWLTYYSNVLFKTLDKALDHIKNLKLDDLVVNV